MGVGVIFLLPNTTDDSRWVRGESRFARTHGPLLERLTLGVRPARDICARVLTTVAYARQRRRTVRALPAAHQTHLVQANVTQEAVVVYSASYWKHINKVIDIDVNYTSLSF